MIKPQAVADRVPPFGFVQGAYYALLPGEFFGTELRYPAATCGIVVPTKYFAAVGRCRARCHKQPDQENPGFHVSFPSSRTKMMWKSGPYVDLHQEMNAFVPVIVAHQEREHEDDFL